MAKQQKAKTTSTGRNDKRRNGKAFGAHADLNGALGHRDAGRTKPSGKSVGGHSLKKLKARAALIGTPDALKNLIAMIKKSRTNAHRSTVRQERKAAALRAASVGRK